AAGRAHRGQGRSLRHRSLEGPENRGAPARAQDARGGDAGALDRRRPHRERSPRRRAARAGRRSVGGARGLQEIAVRGACLVALLAPPAAWAASKPATLDVDARDAARGVIHAHLTIPVAAGQVTLAYPKWIPGEHGPTGPIVNVAGLRFTAGGGPLAWARRA